MGRGALAVRAAVHTEIGEITGVAVRAVSEASGRRHGEKHERFEIFPLVHECFPLVHDGILAICDDYAAVSDSEGCGARDTRRMGYLVDMDL